MMTSSIMRTPRQSSGELGHSEAIGSVSARGC
jgi:hypothetical protein